MSTEPVQVEPVFASPLVRRLARLHGLAPADMVADVRGIRINRSDVERIIAQRTGRAETTSGTPWLVAGT